MGDNLPNILLPVNEWVDLYALSGITPGLSLMVENVGSADVYLTVQNSQPATDHDSYNVVQRGNGVRLQNAPGASGAWAFCNSESGKVQIGLAQQDGFFDPVGAGGVPSISPPNSSDVPIAGGGTFVGEWIDTTGIGIVYISAYSDVASATDGLIIEQSTDGITAHFDDVFTVPADHGKNFSINPHARFLRVRYINGSIDQSVFALQTKLNHNGLASSHRIKDDINTDDDARLVKSVLSVKANDLNQYKNIERINPMPVNGDLVYAHDVSLIYSNMYTFSGSAIDLFDDIYSTDVIDSTLNNPKKIDLYFVRPIQTATVGIGTVSGSISNTVIKYGFVGIPGDITLLDESADSTPKTFVIAPSVPIGLVYLKFEFHTTNTISISNVSMGANRSVVSRIQGIDPGGEVRNIGASHIGNLNVGIQEYGDTSSIDAFDRLRVSQPFTIFDSKQLYDKQPLFYDELLGGSATSVHSIADARTRESVTASASDFAIRQTKQRFNYQPGKSQLSFFTFYAPQQVGCIKRIGIFDGIGTNYLTPNNGIFLSITEDNIYLNISKNGSITESVQQSDWNQDKLDGSGSSTFNLDMNSTQILVIDFEWLGVGRVRCGFVIDGLIQYVHFFNHANYPAFTSVYMSTPNLPIRYDITSDGSGAGYLDHICSTVMSEGGVELTGISRSIDTTNTHLDADSAGTAYVLLALRLKSTHLGLTVLPQAMTMISLTNDDFRWLLLLNPTYNGTLTFNDEPNGGCQRAAGTTTNSITSGGTKLASGFAKSGGSIASDIVSNLRIGSKIDGTRDELVLAVVPISSNADFHGSLTYRELL